MPELLADKLKGRPRVAARSGRAQPNVVELLLVAEVGEFDVELPAVVVVGDVVLR
jgi:hypothetical protein